MWYEVCGLWRSLNVYFCAFANAAIESLLLYTACMAHVWYSHRSWCILYSLDVERVDPEGERGQLSPLYPTFQHSTPSEQPMRYIAMHLLHVALLCFCTLLCAAPHNSVQCSMHSTLCGAVDSHRREIFCDQQTNSTLLPIQLFCIRDICQTKNINLKNLAPENT